MNTFLHWLTSPEWTQTVKALLHTLWQSAAVAGALGLLLRRVADPVRRYRYALGALAVVLLAGLLTWAWLNQPDSSLKNVAANAPAVASVKPEVGDNLPAAVVSVMLSEGKPASAIWTAWLALVWLGGAVLMLGRAGWQVAGAERLRRATRPLDDPRVAQLLAEAQRAVRLTRKVRVAVTDKLTSPAVVGVLVPTLILPLSLLTTLTPEQLQFVLLHELAHIRRGDYFANLFQLFVEALLFFNPAVWWISQQVRREREACCDALAIELSGAPVDYAKTLVCVAENSLSHAPAAAPAFGDEREPSSLADRVQRLLVPGYRPSLRLTWRAMLAAVVVSSALLFFSAVGARNVVGAVAVGKSIAESKRRVPEQGDDLLNNQLLETRLYKVDSKVFEKNLRNRTATRSTNSVDIPKALKKVFADAGVVFVPPKAILFDEKKSELSISTSSEDWTKVDLLIGELNPESPQVRIEARFLELPAESLVGLAILAPNRTNGTSRILKAKDAKALMSKLEHLEGVDMLASPKLASPKMITLSGSHAQVSITHMQTIVTGVKPVVTNGVTSQVPQTEAMQFGLMLDLVAVALPDGFTLRLTAKPSVKAFLGYEKIKPGDTPKPIIRELKSDVTTDIRDGDTLVLGGMPSEDSVRSKDKTLGLGNLFRSESTKKVNKQLLVLVTPRLVDETGKPVNSDEELSK